LRADHQRLMLRAMEASPEDRPPAPGPRPSPGEMQSLRASGHGLKPAVTVGRAGVTPAVVVEVRRALSRSVLIKVRIDADAADETNEIGGQLAEQTGCHLIQRVGRVILLYRRPDEELEA
jgi:RNA-binding protein